MTWRTSTVSTTAGRGWASAVVLAGTWRADPPLYQPDGELLASVANFLLGSGAGGLTWWRLRLSPLRDSAIATEFQQAYHLHSIQAALHQEHLERVLLLLRRAGVEPLLCKGWAIARLYPEPGLRPYGDLDLCVEPGQLPRATAALDAAGDLGGWVDLHAGIPELADRPWGDLLRRSRVVGPGDVRVLGPEDQLRQLALHLLRHGAWRPLWLCDVATAVEGASADFDWECCLSGCSRQAEWVAAVLMLAQRLLGAQLPDVLAPRLGPLPRWLERAVLRQWGSEQPGDSHTRDRWPMASYLRHPQGMIHALRCRWPNPIEAAFRLGAGPRGPVPAVFLQIGFTSQRLTRFITQRRFGRRGKAPAGAAFEVHQ